MATTSTFSPGNGVLTVIGDSAGNTIVTSRDTSGRILVNGGAVKTIGGQPTVDDTSLIQIFGQSGNDTISVDETNGPMPTVNIFGGDGDDRITGGSGNDLLFGQAGNDTINGGAGNDLLFGGDGNDTLDGGSGNDQLFGEAGDDVMIWNPGGGTDLFEGGDGNDTAQVNGGSASETFTITANGSRVRFDRLSPDPFSLDIGTTENLVLHAGAGDDTIFAGNGLSSLISLTLDGGDGNDSITGGDGSDLLLGGAGNDLVIGGRGNDNAQLGSGDDTFVWNPGDGSDVVEGQAGTDTMLFNGANVAEKVDITANGSRVRFTRDIAGITMDINSMEVIDFTARGGVDQITVGDLTGTGTKQVIVDLGSVPGTNQGDGAADTVTVTGADKAEKIKITSEANNVTVTGMPELVNVLSTETIDNLTILAQSGNDSIDASGLAAVIGLTIDGGAGNDTIIAGHGSETVIGGDGTDTLVINGNGTDNIVLSSDGINTAVDVGNDVTKLSSIERVQINGTGGTDNIFVGDLTGSGITQVAIDLGNADGVPDTVTINGSAGDDHITVVNSNGSIVINGLAAQVTIAHAGGQDSLTFNGGTGNDIIDASALPAGRLASLTINGGAGNDIILGSGGNDTVFGGQGSDTANLGAGNDTFVWNPGDGSDVVEGQAGIDALQFNGANIAENIDISANGGRVRFTRDIAGITMDLNSVEDINFKALGGADTITVNDLTGTGTQEINLDLGANDGAADTVVINATNANDVITVSEHDGIITVSGLSEEVNISNAGAGDRIVINGLDGDDVIAASGLQGGIQLVANGGNGADVLIGSSGNDELHGDAGDDVLIGNGGTDILDGGTGANVVINGGAAPHVGAALLSQAMASSLVPAGDGHADMPMPDPQATQPVLAPPQHA